jgi:hypothetical protein
MPRLLWPSWRWMTTSGTPSRVHSELAPSALAAPHQQRAAALIEIGLYERERLLDAEPGAPQDHDQAVKPAAVGKITRRPHDGDDLLDLGRIRRGTLTLVPWRSTGVESRHGRR